MASLNVAIPGLVRSTHASQTQLEWIIDAYLLVFAVLLLPAGALGDRYGRRKALIAGLVVFGAASAAAMAVSSANDLIVLRGRGQFRARPAVYRDPAGVVLLAGRLRGQRRPGRRRDRRHDPLRPRILPARRAAGRHRRGAAGHHRAGRPGVQ